MSQTKKTADDASKLLMQRKEEIATEIRKSKTKSILQKRRLFIFSQQNAPQTSSYDQTTCIGLINALRQDIANKNLESASNQLAQLKILSAVSQCQEWILQYQTPESSSLINDLSAIARENIAISIDACWITSNLACSEIFNTLDSSVVGNFIKSLLFLVEAQALSLEAARKPLNNSENIDKMAPKSVQNVIQAAFWCLSNMAANSNAAQAMLDVHVPVKTLWLLGELDHMLSEDSLSQISYLLVNITSTLHFNTPKEVEVLTSIIEVLLINQSEEVTSNLIICLSNLAKQSENAPILLTFSQKTKIIQQLLTNQLSEELLDLTFTLLSNLLTLDLQEQSKILLASGLKHFVQQGLNSNRTSIRAKSANIFRLLISSGESQSDLILFNEINFISKILSIISIDSSLISIPLLESMINVILRGNNKQITLLIENKIIECIYEVLREHQNNEELTLLSLAALNSLLMCNKQTISHQNPKGIILQLVNNSGITELFDQLQNHKSELVYEATVDIIDKHFEFEEDMQE